jgi:hypothetical protein
LAANHEGMRRTKIILLMVLLVLVGIPGWLTSRVTHQEYLNRELIAAIKRKDDSAALAWLDLGADANAREVIGSPVPFWQRLLATLHGQAANVTEGDTALLLAMNVDPWVRNGHAWRYVPSQNLGLLRALIQHGANVNVKEKDERGFTPLHFTAIRFEAESTRLMLDAGANINAQDKEGDTTLMVVITFQRFARLPSSEDRIRLLLDRGAGVNIRNKAGESAHSLASKTDRNLRKIIEQAGAKE